MPHRWQFPFFTKEEAEENTIEASIDTGKKAFVKRVAYEISYYKIFTSEEQAKRYIERKKKKFQR